MAVSNLVISAIQHKMEYELEHATANIPNVDMKKFTEALAKGVAEGLERWEKDWEEDLTEKLQRKWKRDIDDWGQKMGRIR